MESSRAIRKRLLKQSFVWPRSKIHRCGFYSAATRTMAQKRTTLRGWKKPEDGKISACRLISRFVCIFGGIKWDYSKSLPIYCAEQPRTNRSVISTEASEGTHETCSRSRRASKRRFANGY